MAKYDKVGEVYQKQKEPFFWTRVFLSFLILCFTFGWIIGS